MTFWISTPFPEIVYNMASTYDHMSQPHKYDILIVEKTSVSFSFL